MFDKQSYVNILDTVRGDIQKVESKLCSAICVDNPFYYELLKFLKSPSKRIRSLIAILYLKACGFEVDENQINLLSAVELIHNASLIHDDVIDEDKMRRREKTLNAKFGNKMAIISGDYLLSVVMKTLTDLGRIELFEIFSKTIKNMCEGEIRQYSNLYKIPTIDEYIEKTYQKTGSLFTAGMLSSMFLAVGEKDLRVMEFAKNFGIAFQIRDDLDNVLNSGKDIKDGIYNSAVIYSGGTDISSSGIEKSKILLNNYLDNAQKYICDIKDSVYKSRILEILELLNG